MRGQGQATVLASRAEARIAMKLSTRIRGPETETLRTRCRNFRFYNRWASPELLTIARRTSSRCGVVLLLQAVTRCARELDGVATNDDGLHALHSDALPRLIAANLG